MEPFSKQELEDAHRAIQSLISKCEKSLEKLRPNTSQTTLLKNRIKAFHISAQLIEAALTQDPLQH